MPVLLLQLWHKYVPRIHFGPYTGETGKVSVFETSTTKINRLIKIRLMCLTCCEVLLRMAILQNEDQEFEQAVVHLL